jgi:multiple sugar transport system ATP-binding protein
MASVTIEKASKTFPGGVQAVRDFALEIRDGEFIVLVGPSGCGKSTMLRMIAGLEEISAGTIRIGDRVVNDVPPKDRDIAMVFQNYALYPHMSVYENMAFGLKLRRFPRREIEQRVRQAARTLGIEALLERKPKALSGGQRQRVAVGRAIVRQPKVFLFDEPLSNLDAKLRVEMRAELKRLHHDIRTTTVYVTHDQEEAMTLGDRIVVMKDGVIQQVGTPFEVYSEPANRFVAGFVGTPPMNFLAGQVVADAAGLWFDEGAFRLRLDAAMADALRPHAGAPTVLGVRPEALSLQPEGRFAGVDNRIPGKVLVLEPLGEKMDAYVAVGAHRAVARVDADSRLQEDQAVALHADMRRVHVFAQGEFGANLSLGA